MDRLNNSQIVSDRKHYAQCLFSICFHTLPIKLHEQGKGLKYDYLCVIKQMLKTLEIHDINN